MCIASCVVYVERGALHVFMLRIVVADCVCVCVAVCSIGCMFFLCSTCVCSPIFFENCAFVSRPNGKSLKSNQGA